MSLAVSKKSRISKKQIMSHLVLVSGALSFFTFYFGYNSDNLYLSFLFSCFLIPSTLATSYFVNYFLLPKYLLTKKYKHFALYSTYTIIVSAYLVIISFMLSFIFIADLQMTNLSPLSKDAMFVVTAVYIVVVSSSMMQLLKYNYLMLSSNQELKEKVLETALKAKIQELQFLKNQINPHFLFNTLNTLYGLALKKSEYTPETIIRLSNLMDYILYHSDNQLVELQKEINHINDYIALEKMRFGDKLNIVMKIEGKTSDLMIHPMLLIPFIENCFKHGSMIEDQFHININLSIVSTDLVFQVTNSKKENSEHQKSSEGIGIKNTQRRLQLLYGDNYKLQIVNENTTFSIMLSIDTKKINNTTHE